MTRRPLERGDIVLATIPFTDLAATKLRPALIVSPGFIGRDLVLIAISSVPRGQEAPHDVLLDSRHAEFSTTGLIRSSVVRTHHLVTVEQRVVSRRLGILPALWQAEVDRQLRSLLGLNAL